MNKQHYIFLPGATALHFFVWPACRVKALVVVTVWRSGVGESRVHAVRRVLVGAQNAAVAACETWPHRSCPANKYTMPEVQAEGQPLLSHEDVVVWPIIHMIRGVCARAL